MKLTTKQLKQMIREELNEMLDPDLKAKLDTHLQSSHPDNVRQGLFIADMYGIPITVQMISSLLKNDDPIIVVEGIEMALEYDLKIKYNDLSQNTKTLMGVVKNPTVQKSPEMMRVFATAPAGNTYILAKVARTSVTPVDVLEDLAKNKSGRVQESLALNDSVTPEILDILSKNENPRVLVAVALSEKTSAATLDYLVGLYDKSPNITHTALQNENISNKTLIHVALNHFYGAPRETAQNILKMRNVEIPVRQDKFSDDEMDEYEQMFGDHNDIDLSGINLEDDDNYEF